MLKTFKNMLSRLHRDEQGADMVEYILIVAAIGLPMLVVIILFRDRIREWINTQWTNMTSQAEDTGDGGY
jgi:Flp pilus assembly pilin Flp